MLDSEDELAIDVCHLGKDLLIIQAGITDKTQWGIPGNSARLMRKAR